MALVLDAGGLIAIDRSDRKVGALLRVAQSHRLPVRTSAAVLAQVWRADAKQANLARTIAGIDVAPIERSTGRRIGRLLAASNTHDIVDGHIALLANHGDIVVTSDAGDIQQLLDVCDTKASVNAI